MPNVSVLSARWSLIIQKLTWYTPGPVTAKCNPDSPAKIYWKEGSIFTSAENHLGDGGYAKCLEQKKSQTKRLIICWCLFPANWKQEQKRRGTTDFFAEINTNCNMFGNTEMTEENLRPRPRPEKFENAASFLRLGFPSNLIKNDFVIIIISFPCPSFPQTHIRFLRFQISLA